MCSAKDASFAASSSGDKAATAPRTAAVVACILMVDGLEFRASGFRVELGVSGGVWGFRLSLGSRQFDAYRTYGLRTPCLRTAEQEMTTHRVFQFVLGVKDLDVKGFGMCNL